MTPNLYNVDKPLFDALEPSRKIICQDLARRFAYLTLTEQGEPYGLSWPSETIEPVLKESLDGSVVWVAVDERIAAIDAINGNICLSMGSFSFVLDIVPFENMTAVLTQLHLILFNNDFSLRSNNYLPDYPEELSLSGNIATLRLIDKSFVCFNV